MKKIIKFLDNHRFVLIILVLLLISISFLSIKSIFFLNHKFQNLACTNDIDEMYCYNKETKIYRYPEEIKKVIFTEKKDDIKALKEKYKLPDFNFYTSYYYEVASLLNYNETEENKDLLDFFTYYNTSYNLSEFYKENVLYYNLFYRYKINLN